MKVGEGCRCPFIGPPGKELGAHLKVFLDLTPVSIATRLPAPSLVASELQVLTNPGHALIPMVLQPPPSPHSPQLMSKQQRSAAAMALGSLFLQSFLPQLSRGMHCVHSVVCWSEQEME